MCALPWLLCPAYLGGEVFSCDRARGEENTVFCHCMSLRSQRYAAPLGLRCFCKLCGANVHQRKRRKKIQFFIYMFMAKGLQWITPDDLGCAPAQVVEDLISSIVLFYFYSVIPQAKVLTRWSLYSIQLEICSCLPSCSSQNKSSMVRLLIWCIYLLFIYLYIATVYVIYNK